MRARALGGLLVLGLSAACGASPAPSSKARASKSEPAPAPLTPMSLPAPPAPWPWSASPPPGLSCPALPKARYEVVFELGPKDPPGGHTLAFSPEGSHVFAPDGSRDVCLWDGRTTELRVRLPGHTSMVRSAVFDPVAPRLVSLGVKDGARIWDLATGASAPLAPLAGKRPTRAIFSSDGRSLALVHDDAVALCEENGALRRALDAHDRGSAAFSADGRRFLTSGDTELFAVWDAASGQLVHKEPVERGSRSPRAAISPDGTWVAASGQAGPVSLYDALSGQVRGTLPIKPGLELLAIARDGKTVIAGDASELTAWDAQTFRPIGRPLPVAGRNASLSPDGAFIAGRKYQESGGVLLGPSGSRDINPGMGKHSVLEDLAFSPDGRVLMGLSGSDKAGLTSWSVADGQRLGVTPKQRHEARRLVWSPDGMQLAVLGVRSSSLDAKLVEESLARSDADEESLEDYNYEPGARIWDMRSGLHGGVSYRMDDTPFSVAWSPDGARIAMGGRGTASLYDGKNGRTVEDFVADTNTPHAVAFDAKGARLFWVSNSHQAKGQVVVRSAITGKDPHTWPTPGNFDEALAVSPDGASLALGGGSGVVVLDASSGAVRWTSAAGNVHDVKWFSGGQKLATISARGGVEVWDGRGGAKLMTVKTEHGGGGSIAIDPTGRVLVAGGYDHEVKVYSLDTGKPVATIPGDDAPVMDIQWNPRSDVVAIARGGVELVRMRDGASVFLRVVSTADDDESGDPVGLVHSPRGLYGGDAAASKIVRFRPAGDPLRAPLLPAVPAFARPALLPEFFAGCPVP